MKHKELDAKTFGELLESAQGRVARRQTIEEQRLLARGAGSVVRVFLKSVREGGAILRGERKPSRSFVVEASSVRAIRERTSLSQSEFANLIGVSVKTLQNWEQDRRRPTGPAAALLRIIAHEPRLALKAIHRG